MGTSRWPINSCHCCGLRLGPDLGSCRGADAKRVLKLRAEIHHLPAALVAPVCADVALLPSLQQHFPDLWTNAAAGTLLHRFTRPKRTPQLRSNSKQRPHTFSTVEQQHVPTVPSHVLRPQPR